MSSIGTQDQYDVTSLHSKFRRVRRTRNVKSPSLDQHFLPSSHCDHYISMKVANYLKKSHLILHGNIFLGLEMHYQGQYYELVTERTVTLKLNITLMLKGWFGIFLYCAVSKEGSYVVEENSSRPWFGPKSEKFVSPNTIGFQEFALWNKCIIHGMLHGGNFGIPNAPQNDFRPNQINSHLYYSDIAG